MVRIGLAVTAVGIGMLLSSCGGNTQSGSNSSNSGGQSSTQPTALVVTCSQSGVLPNTFAKIYASTQAGATLQCLGNFSNGVQIFVNNVAAPVSQFFSPIALNMPAQASAKAPALPLGTYDILITDSDGRTITLAAAVHYVDPPTIANMTPTSGPAAGGTTVTITGTSLDLPGTRVSINARTPTANCISSVTVDTNSATQIVFRTPFQAICGPNTADVSVVTPVGVASAGQFTFTP
jgi:hypothetical protein